MILKSTVEKLLLENEAFYIKIYLSAIAKQKN